MSGTSSAIESNNLGGNDSKESKLKIASEKTDKLSRLSEWMGEWCSSILVKETRQALKSRQFIWTYVVLLFAVGVWTLAGMAMITDRYQLGKELLLGYWFILGFPLGLIIPFTAYRSMAREFEDGTINLMSITTMKPYQIIAGKFGSALLQMMIYLSVLAPCICLTYLLRGISIDQIQIGLMLSVGGSICLIALGLFLAGVFRSRTLGVGVSVLFVLFLGWLYFGWCIVMEQQSNYGNMSLEWDDPQFCVGFYAIVAFFGSTAVLLLVTAASQISFPSDNRSTWIRVTMFVQQILFFALMVMLLPMSMGFGREPIWSMVMFAGHYWLILGLLMIGESSVLSRRVQRTLPRTNQARSWWSLFMPGSGRGFLFAVANLWTCLAVILLIGTFGEYLIDDQTREGMANMFGRGMATVDSEMILSGATICFYVTWFLALFYLVNRIFLDKRKLVWSTGVGPTVSLLLGGIFVALLSIGSGILHFTYFYDYRDDAMSPFTSLNMYLTSYSFMDNGGDWPGSPFNALLTAAAFSAFLFQALVVIAIAIALSSKELLVKPIEVPERVKVEDRSNKPSERTLPKGESIDEIFGELKPKGEAEQ